MVNRRSDKSNSDYLYGFARISVDQLRSVKLESMINPIPDSPCDALEFPAVYSFVDRQVRRNLLEAVYESVGARPAVSDQLKQIRDDERHSPKVPGIVFTV